MNAYELADELEGWSDDWLSSGNKKNVFKKHANMLRQQADRIAELSKNVDELEEELLKTPQIKELSDEEIKQIWYSLYPLSSSSYWDDKREGLAELKFARAILKKASEK